MDLCELNKPVRIERIRGAVDGGEIELDAATATGVGDHVIEMVRARAAEFERQIRLTVQPVRRHRRVQLKSAPTQSH